MSSVSLDMSRYINICYIYKWVDTMTIFIMGVMYAKCFYEYVPSVLNVLLYGYCMTSWPEVHIICACDLFQIRYEGASEDGAFVLQCRIV